LKDENWDEEKRKDQQTSMQVRGQRVPALAPWLLFLAELVTGLGDLCVYRSGSALPALLTVTQYSHFKIFFVVTICGIKLAYSCFGCGYDVDTQGAGCATS
jgi:hypothetical protein